MGVCLRESVYVSECVPVCVYERELASFSCLVWNLSPFKVVPVVWKFIEIQTTIGVPSADWLFGGFISWLVASTGKTWLPVK